MEPVTSILGGACIAFVSVAAGIMVVKGEKRGGKVPRGRGSKGKR